MTGVTTPTAMIPIANAAVATRAERTEGVPVTMAAPATPAGQVEREVLVEQVEREAREAAVILRPCAPLAARSTPIAAKR